MLTVSFGESSRVMMIKVSIKINVVLKRLKTIKFRMMIKNRNKIGLPFEVVINGKKMLVVSKKVGKVVSPCDSCDLRDLIKTRGDKTTPRNCHRFVPSCFAFQRVDNTSVVYRLVKE